MERKPHITESGLLDFFNDKLSVAERQEILDWKEACEENRRLFEKMRKENLLLREVVRAKLIKGDYSVIRSQIEGQQNRVIGWTYWVAVAAVVAVIVSAVPLWRHYSVEEAESLSLIGPPERMAILELADGERHYLGGDGILFTEEGGSQRAISSGKVVYDKKQEIDMPVREELLVYNKITVPRGAGVYLIKLNDGSVIWLNSDSYLEYPEKFARGERRVRITGEAFFKVVRDAARPFVVETAGQSVIVLGTEFNVHAYPSEPVTTTLASGKVKVTPVGGTGAVVLAPGERSVLNADNRLSVHPVKVSDVISWKNGIINIENMALKEILKVVSRTYDVDFAEESLPAEDIILQGSVSSDESLEVFLAVLSKVADVKFKMRNDGKIEVQPLN